MFAYLLADPRLLDRVRAGRALVAPVLEETLRLKPPTQCVYRLCAKDAQVEGGADSGWVAHRGLLVGGQPRPACLRRADVFRLGRTAPHLSIGNGVHLCLGINRARMEATSALNGFLDRMPRLRPDAGQPALRISGIAFRSPAAVPLALGLDSPKGCRRLESLA
jgi:cytochrome P450